MYFLTSSTTAQRIQHRALRKYKPLGGVFCVLTWGLIEEESMYAPEAKTETGLEVNCGINSLWRNSDWHTEKDDFSCGRKRREKSWMNPQQGRMAQAKAPSDVLSVDVVVVGF